MQLSGHFFESERSILPENIIVSQIRDIKQKKQKNNIFQIKGLIQVSHSKYTQNIYSFIRKEQY